MLKIKDASGKLIAVLKDEDNEPQFTEEIENKEESESDSEEEEEGDQ